MKRHPFDPLSLIAGVVTIAVAAILFVPDVDVRSLWDYAPLALVALGVALLASAVSRSRRPSATAVHGEADDRPVGDPDRSDQHMSDEELIRDSLAWSRGHGPAVDDPGDPPADGSGDDAAVEHEPDAAEDDATGNDATEDEPTGKDATEDGSPSRDDDTERLSAPDDQGQVSGQVSGRVSGRGDGR